MLSTVPRPATPAQRDRFLAFAFAAAELLVEIGPDGRVEFAAGAFNARLGVAPESMIGRFPTELVAPDDRSTLSLALSVLSLRGRLRPQTIRLADHARTPMVLGGLTLPDTPARLCLTLGPLPLPPRGGDAAPTRGSGAAFLRAVETRVRSNTAQHFGVLEVSDAEAGEAELHDQITGALRRYAGPDRLAGEIGRGRYGVVGEDLDMKELLAKLEALVSDRTGRPAHVQAADLGNVPAELSASQAARTLRFALIKFAKGGMSGLAQADLSQGLAGFVATTETRARAVQAAIADQRFRLVFQPVVRLRTREVHHFEALIRPTRTPDVPVQSVQEFVTFAEAVGLAEELDRAVLGRALHALRAAPGARVAVNISSLSLESANFRDHLAVMLQDNTATCDRLLIEMTETGDIEDPAAVAAGLSLLREASVPICLDDFGAGYADFRYLRDFPVDFVKIDGAYVRGTASTGRDSGFIVSMVELANWVGARSIAEMIETPEQAHAIAELGVEFGQGWLFGRPGALPGSL